MIVYVDMDDTLCEYTSAIEKKRAETGMTYPQAEYGFYRNLLPKDDMHAAVFYLQTIPDVEVYILTAPSVKNPLSYTEKMLWVEDHFGMEMVEKLIISPNKGLLKGDILIDDLTSGKGQESFEGEVIQFGSSKFPTWRSIIEYIEEYYEH